MLKTRNVFTLAATLAAAITMGCGADDGGSNGDGDGVDGGNNDDAFTMIFASSTFQACKGCHAPGAPGFVEGTETTQNWSTRDNAFSSLMGSASGLIGNFAGCNGVPLLGDTAATSLLVAALDSTIRADFTLTGFPDCVGDTISDMTLKVGAINSAQLDALKAWINAGAPDM